MKQTITKSMFRNEFIRMNRVENFSYKGLGALYDYLEEMDENYDLEVIALCCEYCEETIKEALENHNLKDLEELEGVIWCDGVTVLYVQY